MVDKPAKRYAADRKAERERQALQQPHLGVRQAETLTYRVDQQRENLAVEIGERECRRKQRDRDPAAQPGGRALRRARVEARIGERSFARRVGWSRHDVSCCGDVVPGAAI
ncbi:hypothetical protein L0Z36_21285 [Burkholderia multivorans]|uniref:hypothetical protein n=1 Tax=Burkholderia multivorans TaxID=87883 RepID=UPI0020189FA5|nr:hypothetical protein [Burkholderia multivorans]UQP03929.1 hypothetical protein L0Z36_21285 [Burkholderia multivorans]